MRDLRAAIRNQPPAEHDYDWAPIHMPGTVQGYGVLLVTDPQSRRVLFVSDNATELLGIAPSDILDKSYLLLTDSERERKFLKEQIGPSTILFPNPVRLTVKGREFDAVFHAHGGTHQIEIEPVPADAAGYDELSLRATAELYDPPSIDELYQRAVRVVREASGFDRVMLYRFDPRYNGQVIAESTREGIGSFLGLFFPSSDIGARARDMYLQNFTRYIPDIGGKAYPLRGIFPGNGQADSAHPVDMSLANLRSVVPCHITYLQNIGVKASMSFSINVDGRLWGLFACHHYAPRRVSYDQRVVCEQTAMMFIYRLAQMSSTAARLAQRQQSLAELGRSVVVGAMLRRRITDLQAEWRGTADEAAAQTVLARMIATLQAECAFLLADDTAQPAGGALAAPARLQQLLLDLVEADSAAIVRHGRVWRIGDAPSEMAIYGIASMIGRELPDLQNGELHVHATDCLSVTVPVAESIKDRAAGILVAALSLDSPAYIMWFRREQIVHATWAGNPAADAMSAGAEGNNPRASFEAWKQDIRNLSRSWVVEDVQIADELAALLRDVQAGGEPRLPARAAAPASRPALATAMASAPVPSTASTSTSSRRVIRIGQR
jgi:light-regulated signal transduction histidine kinase (bacteriophytochrome)